MSASWQLKLHSRDGSRITSELTPASHVRSAGAAQTHDGFSKKRNMFFSTLIAHTTDTVQAASYAPAARLAAHLA